MVMFEVSYGSEVRPTWHVDQKFISELERATAAQIATGFGRPLDLRRAARIRVLSAKPCRMQGMNS